MIHLTPLDRTGVAWAQAQVQAYHYLCTRVDPRCCIEGYAVRVAGVPYPAGCLLVGRPEATRCGNWYGSAEDVVSGRCECTRWQVLNLARVWLHPSVQASGCYYHPDYLPGFVDRRGVWRSTLASAAIRQALRAIGYDYLQRRPPVWVDEPYELRYVLSYCDPALHRGVIYQTSGFELYRTNERGLQTWRILVPGLDPMQDLHIRRLAAQHPRSIRLRAERQAAGFRQPALLQPA